MAPGARWRPLLDGDNRERALQIVGEIADRLKALRPDELDHSVSDGTAGVALFFEYLDVGCAEADDFLGMAIEKVTADPQAAGLGLYAGLCGVGWVGAHFDRLSGCAPEAELDGLIVPLLATDQWQGPWELMYGLVGIGVYALESGSDECLRLVVDQLNHVNPSWITDTATLFGSTRATDRPARYVDLGMAHGVPGALALLSAAARQIDSAEPLASAAARLLLTYELPTGGFPALVDPQDPRPSRLAWCYGDPGVAAALAAAANVMHEPDVSAAQQRTAKLAAERPFADSGVTDLGLCHGVAGVAHTLARLACADESLAPSALAWACRLVDSAAAGELPAEPGFLTGQAGIALALLAACDDRDPSWDRVMLLSAVDQ